MPLALPMVSRRERLAELVLLEEYDRRRIAAGHDYGSGQRGGELSRRRRELDGFTVEELRELGPTDIQAAWDRVGARRHRRAELDATRYGSPGVVRTLNTWRVLARRYGSGS